MWNLRVCVLAMEKHRAVRRMAIHDGYCMLSQCVGADGNGSIR